MDIRSDHSGGPVVGLPFTRPLVRRFVEELFRDQSQWNSSTPKPLPASSLSLHTPYAPPRPAATCAPLLLTSRSASRANSRRCAA